jgi:hypothetical protein
MRFETQEDLQREKKAIDVFVNRFGGGYQKLAPDDVDYRVYDKDKTLIAYVEVKGRKRKMSDAYPLPVAAKKITKLCDKRLNPTIIWACEDGLLYAKVKELRGEVRWGGRKPRENSPYNNDNEFMMYFPKQKSIKYIRYY